jgi:hypothetical protein
MRARHAIGTSPQGSINEQCGSVTLAFQSAMKHGTLLDLLSFRMYAVTGCMESVVRDKNSHQRFWSEDPELVHPVLFAGRAGHPSS